jgi:EAL domain-containing protein (putative c-di-GMP-specific phosphodiesterase class I)
LSDTIDGKEETPRRAAAVLLLFAMLQALRKLFEAEPDTAAPPPDGGAVTLGDVLRRNWFELWYQPKIELRSKRLVGAEALVRARRPDGSLISPGAFLPGAKEDDMLALTERVILTALRDFEDCAAEGASVKLSVNVPVSALVKLPIARMLREHRPAAHNWPGLILEVTEDEILNDLKIANHVADELRALHCELALDDFGAGYSSLARLRQLPFSELKIDRSYVTNCHIDKVNAGLCETIVELAKRFKLVTVAEGIETNHESHKLQGIGCDIGQGYLFAKPMPKAQFVAALGRRLVGARPPAAKPRPSAGGIMRGLFADT